MISSFKFQYLVQKETCSWYAEGSGRTVGVTELQNMVKEVIPALTTQLHKGEAGRIGIIGGCQEWV